TRGQVSHGARRRNSRARLDRAKFVSDLSARLMPCIDIASRLPRRRASKVALLAALASAGFNCSLVRESQGKPIVVRDADSSRDVRGRRQADTPRLEM